MNLPATILLVRHGSNPNVGKGLTGWLPGVSLDVNGRLQAQRIATVLANRAIAAVYSSPLERAMETAQPLASEKNLNIIPDPAFGEVRFGDWQGRTYAEIESDPIWRQFNNFRSGTRAPGGELMLETQTRMVAVLLKIAAMHLGQTVAVFSHADAIKSALCWALGIPLDFHLRLDIDPGSITTIVMPLDGVPLVRCVNFSPA